jgi:hypothetical protein
MTKHLLLSALLAPLLSIAVQAQDAKSAYPAMAPLDQYLIADKDAEIALARSAAPPSISDNAEVLVLGRDGFTTAVKGTNGFACFVERSWAMDTTEPEFWNPKVRSPNCFNAAAHSFVAFFQLKTKLVLAGKSKAEIAAATAFALDNKEIPPLETGAMCYMMSKQQYLNDGGKAWHPHLMFLVPGDAAKTWGADLPGVPIYSANDPEQRATIFMVVVGKWSDGTPGPPSKH